MRSKTRMSDSLQRRQWPQWLVISILTALACACVFAGWTYALTRSQSDPVSTGDGQQTRLVGTDQVQVLDRAAELRDRLGLPSGVRRDAFHIHDATRHEDYDEVDEIGDTGYPVSLTMISDPDLIVAMRLDQPHGASSPVGSDQAQRIAVSAVGDLGIAAGAPTSIYQEEVTGGWIAHWDRTEDGIRVRGDGADVHVWQDGTIGAVSCHAHSLQSRPASVISPSSAMDRLRDLLGAPATSSGVEMTSPVLQWVRANGAFDASRPIEPDAECQLAWVVEEHFHDTLSGPYLIVYFVSAGDGSLIGGDIVE
jgi:hypothetical protein